MPTWTWSGSAVGSRCSATSSCKVVIPARPSGSRRRASTRPASSSISMSWWASAQSSPINSTAPPPLTYLINKARTTEKTCCNLMGRFYVPSSGGGQRLKLAKQLSGDIALQAPLDVADGLALSEATLHVVLCGAVLTHADQHDGVERAVELSISRPVQSVPGDCS